MNNISLSMGKAKEYTMISNRFIDTLMLQANGFYVKVYLYLLRCASDASSDMSLAFFADKLGETENDVARALRYWEENGAILVKRDSYDRITDITLINLERPKSTPIEPELEEAPTRIADPIKRTVVPLFTDSSLPKGEALFCIEEVAACNSIPEQRPTYSDAQVAQLLDADDIKWLLQVLELRMQRTINSSDIQLILFCYECLGFHADLIVYLYDYCFSLGKKRNSYIEKVAVSWANDGISTVQQANERAAVHNINYNAVFKAFGLNRAPVPAEQQYMKRWFEVFHFPASVVSEACNRTMLSISKPDFKYTDRILENWYQQEVHSLSDLKAVDQKHVKSQVVVNGNPVTRPVKSTSNNLFNRFPQRKYTEEDYSSMEQQLLNKQ